MILQIMKNEYRLIAIVSSLISVHFVINNHELEQKANKCNSQFEAFKQGVIYSR